ncbi:HDOD domain-containing protein [Propionivibrio sp.]|uniref:HDOD domain-containing protein n=2 Tax=Propionivibrio sp. TaxID=2212460 RepID=UPI0025DDA15E|nr:HDOD domain-containing protein [Propionivibrio sp.]MBK7354505.1 HDOD domain-containing protein [Propionivibrio sp.]MBK8401874.1 HDOD domain-containing protein [Propionivibrio sp.]MBK8745598.1 HDOD domain-containing protein [Propionivibrio sp.]MBK8895576.1 HDOD domain-containing protein [Propionivibrio sp.]MBL0206787.1 HDOD domain-containing protein [Propionivibrio sp.]
METSQEEHSQPVANKNGEDLKADRFRMLEDIARELAGEVIFPTYFDAALRLRKDLQNPDLPTARIAKIVSIEPLVAAKLMQLAGSALYSPDGSPAKDLSAAISRLGVDLVRTTALAIAMNQLLRSRDMAIFNDLTRALWDHSIRTAAAARILARTYTRINPDEALLAGLVHDLGAFYMLYRAVQYPELRVRPDSIKYLIIQWHEGIGVTLLDALGMPEEIVNATIDHDQPRAAPTTVRTLTDIVYVGNLIAGAHFEWSHQDFDPDAGEVGVVRQNFSALLPEIDADTREMLAVFS